MRLVVRIVLLVSVAGACTWGYWYAVILPRQLELGVLNEEIAASIRARAWGAASLSIRRHRLLTPASDTVAQWQHVIATGRSDDVLYQEIVELIGQNASVWGPYGSAEAVERVVAYADSFVAQRYDSVYSEYWNNFSDIVATARARIEAERKLILTEKRLRRALLRKSKGLKRYARSDAFIEAWTQWDYHKAQLTTEWPRGEEYRRWHGQVAEQIQRVGRAGRDVGEWATLWATYR